MHKSKKCLNLENAVLGNEKLGSHYTAHYSKWPEA